MKITQNIILDFSHIYPEDNEERGRGLKRIDLSDIEGTNMYCTKEAEDGVQAASGCLQSPWDSFSG